jgi:hypothetical protein
MDKFHMASRKLYTYCDLGVKCMIWKPRTKRQLKRIVNKCGRRKLREKLKRELDE